MNVKQLAVILVVAIVVVVAASVCLMGNNENPPIQNVSSDTLCMVYGNANMDNYINEDDKVYIQHIIDGTVEATEYADANYDGVIDSKDIDYVDDLINFTGGVRYYTMDNGEVGWIRGTIKSLGAQYYANMYALGAMGATGIVTCADDETAELANSGEFGEKVQSQNIKNYGYTGTYEPETLLSMKCDAILCGTSYFKNWEELYWDDNTYIAFIRLACWSVDPVAAVVTVATLLQNNDYIEQAIEYAEYAQEINDMVEEAVSKVTEKKSVVIIYPYSDGTMEFQGPGTGCYEASLLAGLNNLASEVCDGSDDEGYHELDLEVALTFTPDAYIIIRGCGWTKTQEDVNTAYTNYVEKFLSTTKAVQDGNVWFTSWRFTQGSFQPIGALMMASEIYGEELFPGINALDAFQDYVDRFTSVNLGLEPGDDGYLDVTVTGMYFNKATNV